MVLNIVLSPHHMLRYALSYLAISTIGAQADTSTTNLIVDTDIFSDVEYVRPSVLPSRRFHRKRS